MGIRTLEEANPGKDMEKLMPGDKINLTIQKPFIDVITREKHRKIESIDYKIKEIKDSSLYIGQKKVKEEGKKGKKAVSYTHLDVYKRQLLLQLSGFLRY